MFHIVCNNYFISLRVIHFCSSQTLFTPYFFEQFAIWAKYIFTAIYLELHLKCLRELIIFFRWLHGWRLPFVLWSSTRITSCTRWLGDLLRTLTAVLSSVDQCSLWNGTMMLTVGNFCRYFLALQLEAHTQKLKWYYKFYTASLFLWYTNEANPECIILWEFLKEF